MPGLSPATKPPTPREMQLSQRPRLVTRSRLSLIRTKSAAKRDEAIGNLMSTVPVLIVLMIATLVPAGYVLVMCRGCQESAKEDATAKKEQSVEQRSQTPRPALAPALVG